MQYAGWILALVALAVAAVVFLSRRSAITSLTVERDRASATVGELSLQAGRVPDLQRRTTELEQEVESLRTSERDAHAQLAAKAARLESVEQARTDAAERAALLEGQYQAALEAGNGLKVDLAGAATALRTANEAVEQLRADLVAREASIADLASRNQQLQGDLQNAAAQRAAAMEQADAMRKFLETAQEQLSGSFREVSGKLLDERSAAHKQALDETIKPFAEQLAAVNRRAEELAKDHARDNAQLTGTISELKTLNQNMADAAGALSKALKGNAKVRGDWGEMILETVLRNCGLEEGRNYRRQAATVDDESGRRRYPDVVIDMPDGRQIVVDSKVSLVAWAAHNDATTPEEAQDALMAHTASIRSHIRDLADKAYPKLVGPNALDVTIMFVPMEGALAAALATNPDLQEEAWSKRLVLATPNTLMAMLKVVERLWMRDRIQKQVDTIATEAGKVLDTVIGVIEDYVNIEAKSAALTKAIGDGRNRLETSPQSLYNRARRLVEAGARGKKQIPDELAPVGGSETLALASDTSAGAIA